MAKINNLEMAEAVSSHPSIKIRHSFFGLIQSVIYEPSGSPVEIVVQDYSPDDGERLEKLLFLPLERLKSEIESKGKPARTAIGNFRLEACLSRDHRFCALQLFRFVDFNYAPATEPLFYEGEAAETIVKLI